MAGSPVKQPDTLPVEAIPAASVLLLRGDPFEVLMLRRNEKSSFVPSAWVFPGGIVERSDEELARTLAGGGLLATMRVAAARETFEESGVWIGQPPADAEDIRRALLAGEISFTTAAQASPPDLAQLTLTSRWITPEGLPKRFDTWFFLARVAAETAASPEHHEAVETLWIRPQHALERQRR